MMTEQETVLKSDDLQERWKSCMSVTCITMQYVPKATQAIQDLAKRMTDIIRELIIKVKHLFSSVSEMFKQCWGHLFTDYPESETKVEDKHNQIYPHGYPPYVHNLKINKQGYNKPIMRCARSRC